MGSLTNVYIPERQKKAFREAIEYYRFNTMAEFLRTCMSALIEHHKKGDDIPMPFQFRTYQPKPRKLNE